LAGTGTAKTIGPTCPKFEATFRMAKSILETRPIYHKCDETIRGHVFCSFLALCLKRELEIRGSERRELIDKLPRVAPCLQGPK